MIASLGFCWFTLALSVTTGAGGIKRPITANDLMRFTWAADPRIAPDGSQVAFVRVAVDADKDDYVTSIWLIPVLAHGQKLEPRRLTNGPRDSAPRWSPDGTRLIFARATEKDGKPQPPQLFLLSLAGGEPRPLTDLPKGASSPAWSPDGKTVVFLSGTTPDDIDKARRRRKGKNRSARAMCGSSSGKNSAAITRAIATVSIPTTSGRSPCPDDRTHPPIPHPSRVD